MVRSLSVHLVASFCAAACLAALIGWTAKPACAQESATEIERLREVQNRVRGVAARALPSVVSITDGRGAGSGVIVGEDGLVLTAAHVVLGADPNRLEVILNNGRTVRAEVVGMNLTVDAAMVRIVNAGEAKWPAQSLGDSESLKAGQWCIAIGHPGGFESTRTAPVRLGKLLSRTDRILVTDCTVVGGDSGGPLFDLNGKLIGIHSSIGPSVAENRHVPIARFQEDWERMRRGDKWGRLPGVPGGQLDRPVLGVRLDREADRAVVYEVTRGGPAEAAGVRAGDVIQRIDGQEVSDAIGVSVIVSDHEPGDALELELLRGDRTVRVRVRLGRATR